MLPSKYKVLGLIPSSANKTGKHKINRNFFSHGKILIQSRQTFTSQWHVVIDTFKTNMSTQNTVAM